MAVLSPRLPWSLVLSLLCVALAGCTSVFLYPDRVDYFAQRPLATPAQEVTILAGDGTHLHGLHLSAQARSRGAVLFLHGNAENVTSHVRAVTWLPAQGYSVLALDYRGYGRSSGHADVDALHDDAEAALAWLARREPQLPLVVYGQSLGGSVGIRLVARAEGRQRIAAVIAESAFSSYRGIAREKLSQAWLTWPLQWPLSLLISNRQSAVDVVDRISPIPLLLIHGERDAIVAPAHSQRLFAAAREPKALWLIPEAGHIDVSRSPRVRAQLVDFLNAVAEPRADKIVSTAPR